MKPEQVVLHRPQAARPIAPASAECYLNQVPAFAEAELGRLYGHPYASLAFMRLFRAMDQVSTYVERDARGIVALILFRKHGRRIDVHNEFVHLDQAALYRFTAHVLRAFYDVDVVALRNLDTDLHSLPLPFQRHGCAEDYVLRLPASAAAYTDLLGKSTRRNLKRYSARLLEDHPSFRLRFHAGAQIDDGEVRTLLRMSEEKITGKGKRFSVDAAFADRMLLLARECGFVAVATIEDRLCAGLICFRNGSHYLAKVVAHDSAYDDYGLGTLCYYRTICEAIERGGAVFNLGMQRYDYKTRLLGVRRDLDRVCIYRSRSAQLRQAGCVLEMSGSALLRQVKLHLQARENSVLTRGATSLLARLRRLRAG